jgi:sugar lactone lactonase YvrE
MRIDRTALLLCLAALLSAIPAAGQATIRTEAGGGPNNIAALSASIPETYHVTADAAGNVFFSSAGLNAVYKVAQSGMMTLVAGNRSFSPDATGDGGPAIQAGLSDPMGLVVDNTRHVLYIADEKHHLIRRVDLATGIITAYAGDGNSGYSGDDGLATKARLDYPGALALDSSGNLFIADNGNRRIRRVDATTQIITTVAGTGTLGNAGDNGPATSATFADLAAVAVDSFGTLYIVDSDNRRVRRVTSGMIYAFAGTGADGNGGDGGLATLATFRNPSGVAVDSSGVYISDYGFNRTRKVNLSNGIINHCAGSLTGDHGFYGDGGAAASALLYLPRGLAINPANNSLLIADFQNNRIRSVASNGLINTVAGNGGDEVSFGGDGGPATDAMMYRPHAVALYRKANSLFIGCTDGYVRKVDLTTRTISTVTSQHGGQTGVAVDETRGALYLADEDQCNIRRVDLATGAVSIFAGGDVCGYSGDNGPPIQAKLSWGASGVGVDSSGNVYIADTYNHVIRKVTIGASPIITTVAGNGTQGKAGDGGAATSAQLNRPLGAAIDSARNLLYIADTDNHRIRRVDLATGIITAFAGTSQDGYSGDGGPAVSAQLNGPHGIAVDDRGNVWIADSGNNRIRMVNRETGVIALAAGSGDNGFGGDGGDAKLALLEMPTGVALDAAGNYWIADWDNHRVRKVTVRQGRVDLLSSWSGEGCGLYQRNSNTGEWTWIATYASQIAAGDFDGDGIDDVLGVWTGYSGGAQLWAKYSSTTWNMLGGAPTSLGVGDIDGDHKAEILGIWGPSIWSLDHPQVDWTLFDTFKSGYLHIAFGDLDGDGKADLIGSFSEYGTYVKYSSTGQWQRVAASSDQIVCGDLDGDGKTDLVGLWGSDVWVRFSAAGVWRWVASGPSQIAVGDLDGDSKDDLIGVWSYRDSEKSGIWIHYSGTGQWYQITHSVPDGIAAIRVP